jgi:hypothetical protein
MRKLKFILIILSILFGFFKTKAQITDTVYPDIEFRANIEGIIYRIKQDPNASFSKKFLLKDTVKVDSIKFSPAVHQDIENNNIYIRGSHFYRWNLINNEFMKLDSFNYKLYGDINYYKNNFYLLIENANNKIYKIHKYNPRNRKLSVFLDLTNELKERKDKKEIGSFNFIDHQKFISITIGIPSSPGILWEEKYMYSFKNDTFYKSNGTELLKNTKEKILKFRPQKDIYLENRYFIGNSKKYEYNEKIIFSSNLIRKGRVLFKFSKIKGYNIKNDKVVSVNVKSEIDSDKEIIIPIKLTYKLDHLLYKIYNGEEINKKSITEYGSYELGLLKNMVFAKHNYGFDTPYYQAFYNLYRFYINKMDSRTKNVNPLLTETDKYNLKLIKEEIERRKE